MPQERAPNIQPDNDHHDVIQQVPHSGVHGYEQPVRHFDRTTLPEAVEQGLVITPDSPATLPEARPAMEDVTPVSERAGQRRSRRGLWIGLGAGAASMTIAAGAFLGLKGVGNAEPVASDPVPAGTAEAPAAPEQTMEEKIKLAEIPAGLSTQELATTFIDGRMNDWFNNGADEDIRYDRLDANLPWPDYIRQRVGENAEVYAPALFGPHWHDDVALSEYVDRFKLANERTINGFVETAWSDPKINLEPYRTQTKVSEVREISAAGDTRTLEMTVTAYTNSNKNKLADQVATQSERTWRVTFTAVDGVERITAIEVTQ